VRLFIALTPPPTVQREVWEAFAPLRARPLPVKWVPPENVHLTLKFLGDVAAERQPDIVGALASAAQGTKTIALVVRGAGAFPNARAPRVVWAGIEPDPAIEILADRVERSCAPLGFPPEGRLFRPHLTIGRAERDARARDWAGVAELLDGLAVDAGAVLDGVDLVRSELRRGGSVYHRVHRERLS
jgi:RNA 2',3'-cyclic 3'-phosphodiesterase